MKNTFIIVTLFGIMSIFSVTGEDLKIAIERDVGIVARQLLEYDWQQKNSTNEVPVRALNAFKYWVNIIVKDSFSPPDNAALSFHNASDKTCDAICTVYERDGLIITIEQTVFTVLVTVKGTNTVASDMANAKTVATNTEKNILQSSYDYSFEVLHEYDHLWIGECNIPKPHSPLDLTAFLKMGPEKGGPFLDRWWSDGKEIAFFGIKVPVGNRDMIVVVKDLESLTINQHWFSSNATRIKR